MVFFSKLLGRKHTPCLAVIDVETTGLNPYLHDRIVEIAVLIMNPDGAVLHEFVTLVNPERDIGPTHIHGISTSAVLEAPRFADIAGALCNVLDGCVALAGHNIRFDYSFLAAEFDRLGHRFPEVSKLCTMALSGGGQLQHACARYGIAYQGQAHSALYDARATAQLLAVLLKNRPQVLPQISRLSPVVWPSVPRSTVNPVTRDNSRQSQAEPPDYLQQLLTRAQPSRYTHNYESSLSDYTALLDRALENRHISSEEGQALTEFATRWSIPTDQVLQVHREYLVRLVATALSDGVVTEAERRDLQMVGALLGIDSLDDIFEIAVQNREALQTESPTTYGGLSLSDLEGKQICFTGESQCRLKGDLITRVMAEKITQMHGINVSKSVTKKLDFLVVTDPLTQSGKANKARQYGIRIIHESVFWRTLGLEVE